MVDSDLQTINLSLDEYAYFILKKPDLFKVYIFTLDGFKLRPKHNNQYILYILFAFGFFGDLLKNKR